MVKKLLMFFMLLAMVIPLWASEHTVTINRNEGLYQTGTGVYYCVKDGIMMTFTSGLDNENYLVEHQQVYFEVNSYNYIIKRIVFHCVDSTTTTNLMDCFYWGPTTLSIVQNFYNQSEPGTLTVTDPYTAVWRGSSNHMQFTTMAKPVRFGSVEIVYDKLDGDIFDLVTSTSQIVDGKTYILVTQNYDKAMRIKMTDDATFPATDIVDWMGPEGNEKSRVKVDGNAQLFRMESVVDTTIDGYSRKSAWLNTLNGYIRPSSTSGSNDLILSTGVTDWNRSYSYIGTASNFLARFKSKGSGYYIRYDSSNNGKFRMYSSITDENTRVWLYKLAEAYNITTVCDPASGGSIDLGNGAVNSTSQQGETVSFTATPNDGYSLTGVDVTADGTTTTIPVTDNGDGTYSFVMPAQDVTLTAHFEIAGAYQIFTESTPAGGGVVNVAGQVTTVDNNNYANGGANVTVTPSPNWGWEATGVTVTDANNNEVTVIDNGNGSYSFTMPESDATIHAGYKRVVGDIFDLVTSGSQIQEGQTYIIVSQNYDKVMRYWTPGQTTFTSAPIVDWPLGSSDKSKVRVDDNAVFFRMDNLKTDTTSTGGLNLTRAAFLNTLNGYMRTGNYNVFLSSPLAQVNRGSMMVSSNAYNYLLRFLYDSTSGSNTNYVVRYNNADGNFNVLNWTNTTDNANVLTRVWLYKLAQAYSITTTCTPPEGGSITITGGMDESNMAQAGETVTLDVVTNWGWTISEVVVTNNDTGETTTITPVATTDAGNSYSFIMPEGNVTIEAKFYESVTGLYLLGTAMGRTSWVPAGPRFNYDANNEEYYLDVYFKGGNADLNVDQAYGYFSLATDIDRDITWQTATTGDWSKVTGRLAAEYNNYAVQDGSSNVVLSSAHPDYAFKIPAGVYRIIVNKDMNRMSIVETPLHLYFDPESGSTVVLGQVVTVSSDLQTIVHGIAQQYSITEDAQAFKNTTDNWATQEADNTAVLSQLGTTTVKAEANIGYIVVPGEAVYNIVPVSYSIEAIWSPENAGSVTVASSANEGQTVTITVSANSGYSLTSLTVSCTTTPQTITPTDNGDGTYSFVMPADNVVIVANFSLILYNVYTVCTPPEAGSINDAPSASPAGETVTFTVDTNVPYSLRDVVLTYVENNVTQTVTLTPNENGIYSFVMPDVEVTVTANYNVPPTHDIYTVIIPDNAATVNGLPDPAQAMEGETVTFTVSNSGDVSLTEYTLHSVTLITNETHDTTALTPNSDGIYSFVMPTEDVTIRVYYVREFDVKTLWSPEQGGSVGIATPDGWVTSAQKNNAETVTFKVTPNADYVIKSIRVSSSSVGTIPHVDNGNGTYSFEMPQSIATIIVVFEPVGEYQIYVENDPAEGGSISLSGHVKTDENGYYSDDGHDVVITPTPTLNWQLTGLDVVDSDGNSVGYTDNGDGSYTMLMPASDVTITAHYEESPYQITTHAYDPEGGQIILHGDAADFNEYAGKTVTVTIKENYGYALTGYTFRAYLPSTGANVPVEVTYLGDSTYSFVMPHANVVIDAHFLVGRYLVSTKCVPENGGTIEIIRGLEDNNHVQHGSLVVVKPVPNEGFALDSIYVVNDQTQDTLELSDYGDGTYGFRMPYDNVTVVAVFRTGYNISTRSVPDGVGEFQGLSNAVVLDGRQIQFTVTSTDDNYVLTGVTVTNDVTGEEYTVNGDNFNFGIPDFNFVMPAADVTITAYFERGYNITWVVLPNEDAGGAYGYQTFESENYVLEYGDNPFVAQRDVNVSIEEMPGYLFESITVTRDDNQQSIVITDIDAGVNVNQDDSAPLELRTSWFAKSFEMPASDVTVTVVFKPYTPLKLIENTMYEGCTDGDTVVVSDDLVVVWAAKDYVWAKDLVRSNYAVDLPNEIPVYDGTIIRDYVKDDLDFQKHEWDQSNWVILDCSGLYPEITNQVERRKKLDDLVDHKIAGGTIKGVYHIPTYDGGPFERLGKFNHVIKLTEEPRIIPHDNPDIIAGSLGYPGYLPDPKETFAYDYSYNHYVATNFLCYVRDRYSTHYIFSHGPNAEEWMQEQDYNTNLFFLPPQDQEVAHVWAVYAGADTIEEDGTTKLVDNFTVYEYYLNGYVSQNVFDLPGGFQVPAENWTFNRLNCGYTDDSYGRPGSHDNEHTGSTELMVDSAYMFHVAIMVKPYIDQLPEKRAPNVAATAEICEHYDVYPLDVDTHGGTVTGNKAVWDTNTASREVESVHYYNLMGQESRTPFDGINIVVTRYSDGSISSEKILR